MFDSCAGRNVGRRAKLSRGCRIYVASIERATTDPSEGQMLGWIECRQHLDALYECT